MHAFMRRLHATPVGDSEEVSARETRGLILNGGWRYDLGIWIVDTTLFRGQLRQLRRRTIELAGLQPGEQVLDVGCGTGTLALEAARFVGSAGRIVGVDPSAQQVARARVKSEHCRVPVVFQTGVIERLPFPDRTFDAAFATLMMHHLPQNLKRQGLAEIARVLKSGGRLVIADFFPKKERRGSATRFHAGGSSLHDLIPLVLDAGFAEVETEEMSPSRRSAFPGAGLVRAYSHH